MIKIAVPPNSIATFGLFCSKLWRCCWEWVHCLRPAPAACKVTSPRVCVSRSCVDLLCWYCSSEGGDRGNSYPNSQQSRIYLPFRLTAEQLHMTNTALNWVGPVDWRTPRGWQSPRRLLASPRRPPTAETWRRRRACGTAWSLSPPTMSRWESTYYNQFHASNFNVSSTNLHRLGGDLAPRRLPSTGEADEGQCQDAEPVGAVRNSPHGPGEEADARHRVRECCQVILGAGGLAPFHQRWVQ